MINRKIGEKWELAFDIFDFCYILDRYDTKEELVLDLQHYLTVRKWNTVKLELTINGEATKMDFWLMMVIVKKEPMDFISRLGFQFLVPNK
ncbi:MAG: hypothetical protein ACRCW9_04015 [Cetobacterium sp.]